MKRGIQFQNETILKQHRIVSDVLEGNTGIVEASRGRVVETKGAHVVVRSKMCQLVVIISGDDDDGDDNDDDDNDDSGIRQALGGNWKRWFRLAF